MSCAGILLDNDRRTCTFTFGLQRRYRSIVAQQVQRTSDSFAPTINRPGRVIPQLSQSILQVGFQILEAPGIIVDNAAGVG